MPTLPNPGMSFTPFDPLPAADLNDMVENIEAIADLSVFADGDVPRNLIADSGDDRFDYIKSGLIWTGDSLGSTLNGSMTSGIVYIGNKKVTVSSVTAHAFTASKDTYVDVDNTGAITYTAVNNNAASPALAANSLRVAIIVTGASSIAAAGSINQGDPAATLPVVSSAFIAVVDTVGNLINPRDPNRKVLGYRQITSNVSLANASATSIVQLLMQVNVPANRNIKVTNYCANPKNSTGTPSIFLFDGTTAGTELNQGQGTPAAVSSSSVLTGGNPVKLSAGVHTITTAASANGGGTTTYTASANFPAYTLVELA